MTAPVHAAVICPMLIGRDEHLATLLRLLTADDDRSHTVVMAGEAGVGKSRLLDALCTRLRESTVRGGEGGYVIVRGYCYEPDRSIPYAGLAQLLRNFLASLPPDHIVEHVGRIGSALVRILPEYVGVVGAVEPHTGLSPQAEQRLLFHGVANLFLHIARSRPMIIAVEDVHWSDDNSLAFLLYLTQQARDVSLHLVLTCRDGAASPILGQTLAALDRTRHVVDCVLHPLSLDETDAMLRAIFGLHRPISARFLTALHSLTDGNPFFIEEVVKSLIATGDISFADEAWDRTPPERLHIPRSIEAAMQQSIDDCSPEARHLLSVAAVAGRQFDFDLLRAVTTLDDMELAQMVKELVVGHLVIEEAPDTFAFRHALTRQAVYSHLLTRERRALHRAIAEARERPSGDNAEVWLADRAYHYFLANMWDKVLETAPLAGRHAQRMYALRSAIDQFSHALAAAERLSLPPSAEILFERGQAYETVGEFESARHDYERAIDAAYAHGMSATACKSLLHLGWLWTGRDYQRAGEYMMRSVDEARRVGEPALLAETLNRVGNWHVNAERLPEGIRHHQEALALFKDSSDRGGQATTLDLLAMASYMRGDVPSGLLTYQQAIALWRETGDLVGLVSSLAPASLRSGCALFVTLVLPATDVSSCIADGEEAVAVARRIGWRAGEASALAFLSLALGSRGAYARASLCAREALERAVEIEHHAWRYFAHIALGALALDLLAFDEARRHFDSALALTTTMGSAFMARTVRGLLATALVAGGQVSEADQVLKTALDGQTSADTFAERLVWCASAERALARSAPGEALSIVDRLLASAVHQHDGRGPAVIPRLSLLRGEALAVLGRVNESLDMLRAGTEEARRRGMRPLLWRGYRMIGRALHAAGRRSEASDAYTEARILVSALANELDDDVARQQFLHRAETLLPHPPVATALRRAKHAYDGLTERERAVAILIADGATNRLIAEELVLSERTVAKHVEHILTKLGFTSRSQVAAWAVQKRLGRHTT